MDEWRFSYYQGATADSLIVFASGVYAVTGSSGNCDVMSADTTINVYSPQTTITHIPTGMFSFNVLDKDSQVDSLAFCETESITLRGPVSFAPGTSVDYQWVKDSVDQFGQTLKSGHQWCHQPRLHHERFWPVFLSYLLVPWWMSRHELQCGALRRYSVPDTFIENIQWAWQSAASLDICPGDSTLLRPNATSWSGDWTYQWEVLYPVSTGTLASHSRPRSRRLGGRYRTDCRYGTVPIGDQQ